MRCQAVRTISIGPHRAEEQCCRRVAYLVSGSPICVECKLDLGLDDSDVEPMHGVESKP